MPLNYRNKKIWLPLLFLAGGILSIAYFYNPISKPTREVAIVSKLSSEQKPEVINPSDPKSGKAVNSISRSVDSKTLASLSALTSTTLNDKQKARSTVFRTHQPVINSLREVEHLISAHPDEMNRLRFRASGACQLLHSGYTNVTLSMRTPDVSRNWAIGQLEKYCDGWDSKSNSPENFTFPSVHDIKRRSGIQAAIQYAWQSLAGNGSDYELFEAVQFLNEQGQAPVPEKLGLLPGEFGQEDQFSALMSAVNLFDCTVSNACGSDSIITLTYCLNQGCLPNSDFLSALGQNVSPRELQLIVAYTQWMLIQRVRGGGG
jgi:hypothetical protein